MRRASERLDELAHVVAKVVGPVCRGKSLDQLRSGRAVFEVEEPIVDPRSVMLMRRAGSRATTAPADGEAGPASGPQEALVERQFRRLRPNELWLTDNNPRKIAA